MSIWGAKALREDTPVLQAWSRTMTNYTVWACRRIMKEWQRCEAQPFSMHMFCTWLNIYHSRSCDCLGLAELFQPGDSSTEHAKGSCPFHHLLLLSVPWPGTCLKHPNAALWRKDSVPFLTQNHSPNHLFYLYPHVNLYPLPWTTPGVSATSPCQGCSLL